MVVGQSPAVARHRLRLALREAREVRELTQREVAKALEWSMSKVNRIESGEVTISGTDLQALLRLLKLTEPDRVRELVELGRASRQRGWWDQPEYREHLTPAMIQMVQFETDVRVIRSFQSTLVPGFLQTREYAEAILGAPWGTELSEADRTVRLELRQQQRERLVNQPQPPEYRLALDESVLLREVGGPLVIAEQLFALLRVIRSGRVTVRVLPFTHPGTYAAFGLFTIYGGESDEVALLYLESFARQDEAIVDHDVVVWHRDLFDRIWDQALDPESSAHLIEARAATHRATADRLTSYG